MDKIEKIRAEIKKRHDYKNEELDDHEIIDYAHSKFYYDKDFDGYGHGKFRPVLTREDLISFARHFAKWGVEQFAKIVRANLSEIGKDAQSQFEQLYFEITGTKMYGGYND